MLTKPKRNKINVIRKEIEFRSDPKRVIAKFFDFGPEERVKKVIDRVRNLTQQEAFELLEKVFEDFGSRHQELDKIFLAHYKRIANLINNKSDLTREHKLLIGSFFTCEYSIESAALFNPSIVISPDQDKTPPGYTRVILSFRATGEGHLSSIEFRQGYLSPENDVILDEISPFIEMSKIYRNMHYQRDYLGYKLMEEKIPETKNDWFHAAEEIEIITNILQNLEKTFTYKQLRKVIEKTRKRNSTTLPDLDYNLLLDRIDLVARSNYQIRFSPDMPICERIIFPVSESESRGIEDARFVQFRDGKETTYYATYTAFDGMNAQSQLLETKDFLNFNIHTINGKQSHAKGLALFPRKIKGQYTMICRPDGENLYIIQSDRATFWHDAKMIQQPKYPWEFTQIGNCGSPVETPQGWLLLTHGVGPMRRYCIGASLLDLDDPSKVIGRTEFPLIEPDDHEREGYVPNVVYSCGCIVNNNQLIIPYAMSDSASSIAAVSLDELLSSITKDVK